jgi:hypothetical protein
MARTKVVTLAPNEASETEVEVPEGTIVDDVVSDSNIAVFDFIYFGVAVRAPNEFGDCAVFFQKDGVELPMGFVSVGVDVGDEVLFRTAKQLVSRTLTNWAFQIR